MNTKNILLNKVRSKNSSNVENSINIELNGSNRLLPTEKLEKTIDEYKQYLKEKKNSSKYRLSFDVNPYCTNVLFNNLTEITYKEGSNECIVVPKGSKHSTEKGEYTGGVSVRGIENVKTYLKYKGYGDKNNLCREEMIRDTSYSHPEIGQFVYHCGYDIFNNHMLRKKEFGVINKMTEHFTTEEEKDRRQFNTIGDYKRYHYGKIVDEDVLKENEEGKLGRENRKLHQYQVSNILSFNDSINENLIEENGWFGFINPVTVDVPNYVYHTEDEEGKKHPFSISLNKCMNNNKANEFYDMYPDRSLFSFTPKINKYRNRKEYNWDYCLTYPYENFYDNELVQYEDKTNEIKVNGLKAVLVGEKIESIIHQGKEYNLYEIGDGVTVTFKTIIKNSFDTNCLLEFVFIGEIGGKNDVIVLENLISVKGVGYEGEGEDYYFSTLSNDVIDALNKFDDPSKVEIRVRQVKNGGVCEYYFRKFKKILNPTTKNNFNSTIGRMGFSKTIYGDGVAQILFNDDVTLQGLRDNLGRTLSEIFLTIIKNNKGHEKWYSSKIYGDEDVTFSHCFGKITSGVSIDDENIRDYNVHTIHNISPEISKVERETKVSTDYDFILEEPFEHLFITTENGIWRNPKNLEDNITIENDIFFGDIVEFSSRLLDETILENVYHRFNTVQREMYNSKEGKLGEFYNLYYDVIKYDDYDIEGDGFEIKVEKYNTYYLDDENPSLEFYTLPANISPEGYYYKAHYRIPLKYYREEVKEGGHTRIGVVEFAPKGNGMYDIITDKNYYPENNTNIIIYDEITYEHYTGVIEGVSSGNYTNFQIRCNKIEIDGINNLKDRYLLYKPNVEKPVGAYELNDGTGVYVWREEYEDVEYLNTEIGDYTFTNGAHYINKKINFHLRRQDPDGRYGLNNVTSSIPYFNSLSVGGYAVDYSGVTTNNPENFKMC